MSVNLRNSSHFDVHDASQYFAVWTEEVPGRVENGLFVLPTVHGMKRDGVIKIRGMAVKLGHVVAIGWDGRVIRHCTSVSNPDGMEVCEGCQSKGLPLLQPSLRNIHSCKQENCSGGKDQSFSKWLREIRCYSSSGEGRVSQTRKEQKDEEKKEERRSCCYIRYQQRQNCGGAGCWFSCWISPARPSVLRKF